MTSGHDTVTYWCSEDHRQPSVILLNVGRAAALSHRHGIVIAHLLAGAANILVIYLRIWYVAERLTSILLYPLELIKGEQNKFSKK